MRRKKLSTGEKFLYFFGFLAIVLTLTFKIFIGAGIGHYSLAVELLDRKIENQLKQNEGLMMQVNELTSFDNVKKIVDEMGLAYHNENIIVINR